MAVTHSPLEFASLHDCRLCPRQCGVDRFAASAGFCRVDTGFAVASITPHRGEEPALGGSKGICNVFFSHCNLRCLYCQNVQISRNESRLTGDDRTLQAIVAEVTAILDTGVGHLGFVSPSHMVPQMAAIIREVRQQGYRPVIVYNTNGYDRVATLQQLENWVDVYLPDCKYMDPVLAGKWSGAADYPMVAAAALTEMYRQKGNILHLDDEGLVQRGLIVRHLVLPGAVANSLAVLRFLADNLSNRITLSLMAQYRPIAAVADREPLNRRLLSSEYAEVVAAMERLGFTEGWIQESTSADFYNPDFTQDVPFGE